MENTNIQDVVAVVDTVETGVIEIANEKETKETREFKEERFDFELYVNDNLICKRNFKINNFIKGSMHTVDFKETVDHIVHLLDSDLKSKSRIYTHYNYLPDETESEFSEPLLEPWECTFKFVVLDNKREVISKIWDGYGYPRAIREKVDFTNKVVKFTNKYGKTYIFDKDTYFAEKGDMLTHEMYVLKQMLDEREDMLLTITKRICAACSPHEGVYQNASDYTTSETYVNPNGEKTKYMYSVNRQNAKYISEWGNAVAKKTKNYFAQFETKKN